MSDPTPVVYIIDDDASIREVLAELLNNSGFLSECFASALDFLPCCTPRMRGCVLLDMGLPDMSGLDLQRALAQAGIELPIVFLSGNGDLGSSSQAFRAGALDFLEKPIDSFTLLMRVREAMAIDLEQSCRQKRQAQLSDLFGRLTAREREVLQLVVAGRSTKEIARMLRISNRTVDVYRAHIMEKTCAKSLVDLLALYFEHDSRVTGTRSCPASRPVDDF